MFTRTRYQNGSLVQKGRSDGSMVWEFRYYETDPDGQRNRKSATVGRVSEYPSESAARKSGVVQALLLRINSESRTSSNDFGAVIARYEKEEMPERYSTRAAYMSYIKNHIRPRWADIPIRAVKTMAVEDWLKRLALAPKSKSHIRSLMHVLFQCAQRWELVDKNPIELVRVRGGSKRLAAPRVLSPQQFCDLAALVVEPYATQIWIAGCLGLRASEIMSLQWSDFDFDSLTVLVQRSVVHGRVDDVKTEYSKDRVPLDPALIQILLEHKERCPPTPEAWLFANPATAKPYHQDTIQQKHIRRAGREAGLGDGIGWHTFRHSYRSWLDDTGAPLTVQKELMRHASIQTTMNVYGKAMSNTKRQAHSRVVQALLPGKKPTQVATSAA
ncbi:MAG TPA: tyrosine-type recombinase/integrase [Bryobacteraceae bacterium]|nr:tyrosine-type recombinase/integrase [Bryobacteraceae bacterium]